ncbi:MAG TPA: hypothetical protein VLH56_11705 [Dissulfurispiraceae bacterium]|nr:hypothetical protein [Dissulfurispiraceae bacterium]
MNARTNRIVLLFLLPCFLLFLSACASPQRSIESRGEEWVSRTLPELKEAMARPDSYAAKIRWKERTYPLVNDDFVFIEPVDSECFIHWKVRPSGLIVGYKSVGKSCEPKTGSPGAPETMEERMTKPTTTW